MPVNGRRHRSFLYVTLAHPNRGSSDSSLSPEHRDIFLFEIGLKVTKLWPKCACPYMDARANFDRFMALEWPDYNIFAWNLFYMISTLELHHISKFQPSSY